MYYRHRIRRTNPNTPNNQYNLRFENYYQLEHCFVASKLLLRSVIFIYLDIRPVLCGYFIYLPNSKFDFVRQKHLCVVRIILTASPATAVRNDEWGVNRCCSRSRIKTSALRA
ncbi:Hypothetical_protein [Hexamita inflata]|uniref:Hypothetical_protein n=1 Tax=Hexamita inflata TaxID=28002 RepID=A0AA86RT19_9EUKA|nr:Hypothetical protein HINF_LOCUS65242 [Hexamita inflata]